ncbi:hypothetical protein CJF30_00010961 [Rutstroemia sp. NJR-2017a BBW]|nr:hypothetical protein CJF30_00010961 [Rutstroemia sp. NJR-2017a BBW]
MNYRHKKMCQRRFVSNYMQRNSNTSRDARKLLVYPQQTILLFILQICCLHRPIKPPT